MGHETDTCAPGIVTCLRQVLVLVQTQNLEMCYSYVAAGSLKKQLIYESKMHFLGGQNFKGERCPLSVR